MADPGTASFLTRANALLRKNLTYQKRNIWSNVRLIMIPFYLCVILVAFQILFDTQINNAAENRCGCNCTVTNQNGKCVDKTCGIEFSDSDQAPFCPISSPPRWPPLLQVPRPESRAVRTSFLSDNNLPEESCRTTGSCPVTILFTGNNHSLGASLSENLLPNSIIVNTSDPLQGLAYNVLGTETEVEFTNYLDPGIASSLPIYSIQSLCTSNAAFPFTFEEETLKFKKELRCSKGLNLWRNNSRDVNEMIFKGYRKGNPEGKTNEIAAAYDLLNTDRNNFNVNIWYNSTYNEGSNNRPSTLLRVPRSVNLVSNSYLQFLQGPGTKMLFEYVKEVPKLETRLRLDIASLIGPLFFTWVILLLFPVILSSLVYEKQERLRIIMKMHGLGDGPYWMISYAYFLFISTLYFVGLMIFGSAIGLKFFRLNDYSIQFTFYFLYVNLQIALCFLLSSIFSKVKTSTVASYIYVFLSGLVGSFLLQFLIEDSSFPRGWIIVLELYPAFSLFRGLYEFSQFAFRGNLRGAGGMKWKDFSDSAMDEVFIIIIVEWFLALIAAYYIDKIVSSGKDPLFFLKNPFKKSPSIRRPSLQRQGSKVVVEMEKPDVTQEIEKVEQLMLEPSTSHAIVCDNLKKVYQGRDGNPPKLAVRGLSLAVPSGECFGMLGPNGAGKSSFINVMTGLLKPTSGTALVRGLDICNDMDRVYTSMGVCPQHDLLWETLTGREHLLFYGRLKNLKGFELKQAVEESLKSVNLFHGGVADKPAGKYSGGMKRRLSVAVSLIGNPKVVYMDEPSTGLDPASRKNLWTVIKRAKQNTAIILTTHSMEEAEFLCDRLGIFVDGSLQCIGNPKELKGRYGGSYVFTMTTSSENEGNVEKLIQDVSPNAKKIYHIAGTQKFELPKEEVRISEVFQAVEKAKNNFTVFAWGLADTTLEDVFIKVARTGQAFNVFS
ncbi:ABC transporter A family member 7 [Hirschfeldia incana]|nr:ABC transporter A family member 7 [Hirschfeldia incana]